MPWLTRITGFEWDAGNQRKSADKHDVTQPEVEQMFLNEPLIIADDPGHSVNQPRHHAIGQTNAGRLLHVTFTLRAEATLIRPISARDMSRKERTRYAQET